MFSCARVLFHFRSNEWLVDLLLWNQNYNNSRRGHPFVNEKRQKSRHSLYGGSLILAERCKFFMWHSARYLILVKNFEFCSIQYEASLRSPKFFHRVIHSLVLPMTNANANVLSRGLARIVPSSSWSWNIILSYFNTPSFCLCSNLALLCF